MRRIELIFFMIFAFNVAKCSYESDEFSYFNNDPLKIGGLFDYDLEADLEEDTDQVPDLALKQPSVSEMMYKFAAQILNSERDRNTTKIAAQIRRIAYGNEFLASETACSLIKSGVIGIIGPSSPEAAIHVRSVCDAKEIPLVETLIDGSSKHVINLHPTPEDLGKCYLDMINDWKWEGFTILYQDAPWLPLVEYVMKNYKSTFTVTIRELDITVNKNFRPQLRRVKQSGDKNILLCSSIEDLPEILKQAQQVGLMTDQHQFILTSLDMHTLDLEPFQHSGTNITGFRMVNPEDSFLLDVMNKVSVYYMKEHRKHGGDEDERDHGKKKNEIELPRGLKPETLQLNTALTFDSISLFHHVMKHHQAIQVQSLLCNDRESTFTNGTSIFNSMKTIPSFKGLSGDVQFDHHGNREKFNLDVLELNSEGLRVIGKWNSTKGIVSVKEIPPYTDPYPNSLVNKTLTVLTVINAPYGMIKDSITQLAGNDQYEGFGIELIEKLGQKLGFNYIWKIQKDGAYGSYIKETGEWDGMLRELMDDRADLAITDLTITSERESAVDFTMPFMTLGISILFEKPKKEDPQLFSFLQPFSAGVWGCVAGCFFLVTFSLFIMGRMSPSEWDNPYPCIEEPEVLVNQFTFKNSMWFSIGAVLQQGSEIAPKAPSTRIVASLWWFFTLIMVSSYTANLAAFLTIENPSPLIESIEDVAANKNNIVYGTKKGGSTISFFRESETQIYKDMYEYMQKNPHLLMGSNDEGLEKAKNGKYAFLMESSTIQYMIERNCEVAQVGGVLDEKGYGIAMKKDSPFRGDLTEAILQLQESGEISRMKTKWWQEKKGGGKCGGEETATVVALNIKNVGGIFLVCSLGCFFALALGVFRWIMNMRRLSRSIEVPFTEVLVTELRFFRQFGTHVKTVQTRKSSTQLNSGNESNASRSRSSANPENIGFRMSLKNINKLSRDDEFDKI